MSKITCKDLLDDIKLTDIIDADTKISLGEGWIYTDKRGTMAVGYDPNKKEIIIHMKGSKEKGDGLSYYLEPSKAQLLGVMIQKSVEDFLEEK